MMVFTGDEVWEGERRIRRHMLWNPMLRDGDVWLPMETRSMNDIES